MSGNMDENQPDDFQQPTTVDCNPEDEKDESISVSKVLQKTGSATAPNKMKDKPGNVTIIENEDQEENDIKSPTSPLRSYGGMQPTEILLSMPPADQELPLQSPSKKKSLSMPPSDDQEPQDMNSSAPDNDVENVAPVLVQKGDTECEVIEVVQMEKAEEYLENETKEIEKENSVQETDLHGSGEVLTSEDTVPVPEGEQQTAIEVDVDGTNSEEVFPKLTKRQQRARDAILNKLQDKLESESPEEEKPKDTCCRCTDDCCLQSCTCVFGIPFSKGDKKGTIKKEEPLLTETLRKGRAEGLSNFKEAIFPLIPDLLRMVWVIFELALVIVGLILSLVTLSLNQNRAFNIIHLVLIILSTLLALVDGIFTFKNSKTCRKICSKCKENTDKEDKNEMKKGCCGKCYARCSNLFDIMRLILSEVIFYPLLVCDIFELIIGRGFEGKSPGDILGIVLFVISLILMILTVYVARIVVLIGMVRNATAVRTPKPKEIEEDKQKESVYDLTIRKSALWYQASFCVHVVLQMLAQLMMYIAIAAKIRYDNRNFYENGNTDEGIHISSNLGFMIFAGYVLPACGLFTFFIVTYYWSQQYPIGYRIDMMSIFIMTKYAMTDILNIKKVVQEEAEKMSKNIHEKAEGKKSQIVVDKLLNFGLNPLKADFDEIFNKAWYNKFLFPFKTPTLVIICLIYAVFQLAFVLCAAQAVDEMGEIVIQILNGGGWVIYYIIAVIVGIIANLYVFLVAGLWVAIISMIIITIAAIIACLILACMLANCGSSSSSSRRDYRY